MPSVDDIPKVQKLLQRRQKLARKIHALQKAKIAKAKIVLAPEETSDDGPREWAPPSERRMVTFSLFGGYMETMGSVAKPTISFKENEAGTIKAFFLRALFEELAEIDQSLFDLGFEFPEGYAKPEKANG